MTKKLLLMVLLLACASPLWTHASEVTEDYYTSPDGTKIYYEVKGSGEAVVLVHGFIVNGESWKRSALYTDLVDAGYKVIIMDLRGNGKSDKPHTSELYDNDIEAKDIMGIINTLGVKKYAAVGYSRGAILVSRLLLLDKRVTRGVMGGMGLDFTNPDWPRRIMFYEALSGKPVKELESVVKYVQDAGLDQQALAYLQKYQPTTSKSVLAKIKKPVLVVSGSEDADTGSAKELANLFPRGSFISVPGDHGGAVRTAEFSVAVHQFLKQ